MPYIDRKDRPKFNIWLNKISVITTKGELEYCIFKLMRRFMKDKPWRFIQLHDATYAAQHCADEFRDRFLNKRERAARKKNGDVK